MSKLLELIQLQTMTPSRWLIQTAKQHNAWLGAAVIVGILQVFVTIVQLGLIAHIIYSAFILKAILFSLRYEFVILLGMIVFRAGLLWLKEIVSFKVGANVRSSLRKSLMQHINHLGPIRCRQFSTAELATTLIEQVEALQDFYAYYLPQMILTLFVPVIVLSVVFSFSWLSGLILLACGPLIPFFMALVGMGAASANRRNFQALARMSVHFLDVLQGLTTLKLFNRSREQIKIIEKVSDEYRKKTMGVLRIAFMSSGVLEFFSAISIALVAITLGLSLLGHIHVGYYGHITLFGALFILLLAPEFFLPLREFGSHYHARAQAIAATEAIKKVVSLMPLEVKEIIDPVETDPNSVVQFSEVAFSYGTEENIVLKSLNFSVKQGEHIYIVGASGTGKTTILNLIMGFLQPISGSIRINGKSTQTIARDELLKQVSWLGQTPKLFHGSLLDNLLIAKPDASEGELKAALAAANADEVIRSLPQGLHTNIGEQSVGLSGGQAQRIALARAFLKNTPLLLLDEPTASLDQQSVSQMLDGLKRSAKNKTVITLTHRLNQLPTDSRVLVLYNGYFVEQGTCADLLARDTHFCQMYALEQEEVSL